MSYPVADCDLMEKMAKSTQLRLSLSVNLIISVIAVPILTQSIIYITKQKLFHFNTRLQIQVHLFGLLMHTCGRLGLHSFDLYNYFSPFTSGCEVMPDFYRCLITRGLYNFGMALAAMCSVSLTIERTIALIYASSYEYCPKIFGFALALLQIFLSFCFLFKLYYYAPFKPEHVVLYYCQTLASGTGSVWTINAPLYSVMVAQIVCRIIFHFLSKKSQQMRTDQQFWSLSCRYNVEQGIRSIHALNMFINANTFVFVFLSVMGTTLHFNLQRLSKPTYFAIVEVNHFLPSYGIILSLYVYSTLRKLDKTLKTSLSKSIKTNPEYYLETFKKQIGAEW